LTGYRRGVRILVTGAAGFIGSNLVDRLLEDDHEVVGIDNLSRGTRGNLPDSELGAGRGFSFVEADLTDPRFGETVADAAVEVICHLGAQIDVRISVQDPIEDARLNVLGTINPVAEIIAEAHAAGALVLLDGAQAVVHGVVDVRALDVDFYVFSGHKLYGPTGIGALYGKADLLAAMPPWQGGGEMIEKVTLEGVTYADPPHRFEAGTPPILEAIGLHAAIDWLMAQDRAAIAAHEQALRDRVKQRLNGANWITDWYAYDADAGRLLGLGEGEKIAGFVHMGTPAEAPLERARPDPAAITTFRPIRAPGSTMAPAPSHEPLPMLTGRLTGNWRPIGTSGSS